MAYYSKGKKRTKKGKKYTQVEKLAYQMGKVKRGLKNPNSRVYASYVNGCTGKSSSNKKPLF